MRFSGFLKDLAVLSTFLSPLVSAQTTWSPPSSLVPALDAVWAHEMSTYSNPLGFLNYGFDQVIANKGYINYCVRWESSSTLTESQRAEIVAAVKKGFKKWTDKLTGFDGWPYSEVQVNVVGWAATSASKFQGSMSGYDVYTTVDSAGAPECDTRCGRFFNQNGDYSRCPGGVARHYDQSLWLTDGFSGGAGGDWGQRMGREYFMGAVNTENVHIFLHEIGHTFALDDFYDWTPQGVTNFIMLAGSSTVITDFDAWMLRDWWRHLKSRYNLSTATTTSSASASTTTVRTTTTTTKATTTPTPTSSSGTVALYGQCGGSGYTGPTVCAQGTCKYSNDWYSQCLN